VPGSIVRETEQWADPNLGLGVTVSRFRLRRSADFLRARVTVGEARQLCVKLTWADIEGPLAVRLAFDEREFGIAEGLRASGERRQALQIVQRDGDQVSFDKNEHTACSASGQLQSARMFQLADELHNRG
jgi:hypothetical protein